MYNIWLLRDRWGSRLQSQSFQTAKSYRTFCQCCDNCNLCQI